MTDELKPRPFCAGNAVFDHDDNGWNRIVCESCGCNSDQRVSSMEDCRPMLAETWNHRAVLEDADLKWKPINSAPKDRRILVWTGYNIYAAHWVQHPITGKEAFLICEGDNEDQMLCHPSHWMPLPEAPKDKDQDA